MVTQHSTRSEDSQVSEAPNSGILSSEPSSMTALPGASVSSESQPSNRSGQMGEGEFTTVASSVLQRQGGNLGARLRGLGLKTKVTLAALILGTAPVMAIGGVGYQLAGQKFEEEIRITEQARSEEMADKINRYMFERYADIKDLAALPTFTDAAVREITPQEAKNEVLQTFLEDSQAYDSIVVFDIKGNPIAQSDRGEVDNHSDREYFQQALNTKKPVISQPVISKTTGEAVIFFAAPVRNRDTQGVIGVVRSRLPISKMDPLLAPFTVNGEEYHIADRDHKFFEVVNEIELGKTIEEEFPDIQPFVEGEKAGNTFGFNEVLKERELISYTPFETLGNMPPLGWSAIITLDEDVALAPQRQLLATLTLGTAIVTILVAATAVVLANQAVRPVIRASETVQRIGAGDFNARLDVPEEGDEFVMLSRTINFMGGQLQEFFEQQSQEARLNALLGDLARVRDEAELPALLSQMMHEVQRQMEGDRITFQKLDSDGSGPIIAEAVLPQFSRAEGQMLSALSESDRDTYSNQQTLVLSQINQGDLTSEQLQQLQMWQVQSMMSTPIFINNELYGLLSIHSCNSSRQWRPAESELMEQLAARLGLALGSFESYKQAQVRAEEERQQKESLQRELLGFLSSVEGASSGDLTVRAQITAGEIGIVADFFNAIVENLRDVVSEVKQATSQVNTSVSTSGESIGKLATATLNQSHQVKETLVSVEEMTQALQKVADKAQEATKTTQQAELTAQAGGQAMEKTVDSIQQVRETVAETAKKVKRLGESSQQISKVVELINQIALKTNLLAVNAGIEAARAGEEGRGFAVVAEEVGALAAQSATATKEIEQIINSIQTGTTEVVEAMESSTTQVVEGTRSVEQAQNSLAQILTASQQVNEVFQMISKETVEQADTSNLVQQLMAQMAKVSESAFQDSDQVSKVLAEAAQVAEKLQTSVSTFKVEQA